VLTFGSLFTGAGGMDLGFERAGCECRWQVENAEYPNRILKKHWPAIRRVADVRDFPNGDLEQWRVDVIVGGPPCQPASNAGLQRGDADERWLWGETIRVIRTLRPRHVILENPPGLLRLVREFGWIIRSLAEIGYLLEWGVLSSVGLGANHRRERLFIHANADCWDATKEWPAVGRQWRLLCPADAPKVHVVRRHQTRQEPGIPRVANGFPDQIHRNRALGNSCDPRVAEWIGRRIVEAAKHD
jgi:DNA (cytosine-5)-methyltransferase 1